MPAKRGKGVDKVIPVEDYEHSMATRTNNPPAGLAHLDREETPVKTLSYDPHLDPQLIWAGKAERTEVEVAAPSIHVHEELSAQKIIDSVRRQRTQQPLFDVDRLDPAKAVEFYQHDLGWSNRMILGDSLMVMSSLLDRERMAGQVQCVYVDPPYGINYRSNFQPTIGRRDVTDGKDEHLTREPEMIQAYRDTWELGVHSYLTYLRDRLLVARELLTTSGSVFVQIGDDNVHRVRLVLDEVFGADNFVAEIVMQKSGTSTAALLPRVVDLILWYGKDLPSLKYRDLLEPFDLRELDTTNYRWVEGPSGERRVLTPSERDDPRLIPSGWRPFKLENATSQHWNSERSRPYTYRGIAYVPGRDRQWSQSMEGLDRLAQLDRLDVIGNSLRVRRYLDDFPVQIIKNIWTDTGRSGFGEPQRYVVQTNPKAIDRCLLMSTDPGDLVLDPTCGSGTTALCAEKLGRRWITIDTSRVALAIARERLLSAVFDYYQLADPARGVDGGLVHQTVKRIQPSQLAAGEPPDEFPLLGTPSVDRGKAGVSGPFTVESLARYSAGPSSDTADPAAKPLPIDHISTLLRALESQGIPRPGSKPLPVESLARISAAGPIQAEGVISVQARLARVAISLGPQFGAITTAQVSDALGTRSASTWLCSLASRSPLRLRSS